MDWKHNTAKVLDSLGTIQGALRQLNGGPASYYFDKMQAYASALFDRFAPWRAGDRVRLVRRIDIPEGHGWARARHFLVPGAEGIVRDVDLDPKTQRFTCSVAFDQESWINQTGEICMVEEHRRSSYRMREGDVVVVQAARAGERAEETR